MWRALVVAAGLIVPHTAWGAGWYIQWDCVGACAGYGNGASGRIGPYESEDLCEHARATDLDLPDDSLFHHFCQYEPDVPPSPGYTGAPWVPPAPSSPSAPSEVELAAVDVGLIGGPGWKVTTPKGARVGPATTGFTVGVHTGSTWVGGALAFGLQAVWIRDPADDQVRAWAVAPGTLGIVMTPKLFAVDGHDVRLDAGAHLGAFVGLGCGSCSSARFSTQLGFGYALEAGLEVGVAEDTSLAFGVFVPRMHLGAVDDLRIDTPPWLVSVSIVGRP